VSTLKLDLDAIDLIMLQRCVDAYVKYTKQKSQLEYPRCDWAEQHRLAKSLQRRINIAAIESVTPSSVKVRGEYERRREEE